MKKFLFCVLSLYQQNMCKQKIIMTMIKSSVCILLCTIPKNEWSVATNQIHNCQTEIMRHSSEIETDFFRSFFFFALVPLKKIIQVRDQTGKNEETKISIVRKLRIPQTFLNLESLSMALAMLNIITLIIYLIARIES